MGTKSTQATNNTLRRAVEALPPGTSLTLPRETLLQVLTDDGSPPNELLTPDETAALLKMTTRWVYRHATDLGAVHLTRRRLRIPRAGVEKYLKRRSQFTQTTRR